MMKPDSAEFLPTRRSFVLNSIFAFNGLHLSFALGPEPSSPAVLDLKVYDAATGEKVPCSVALRTSDGKLLTDNPTYQHGFRSSGSAHLSIPNGKVHLVVSRGFDYLAEERAIELHPGRSTEVVLHLKRVSPLRSAGWVCGDNHVHMKHGEGLITTDFPFMALTARAEALDYMSAAQQWNVATVTPALLSAQCAAVSKPDFTLHWNMEAPKNYWKGDVSHCMGHGWMLGVRDDGPNNTDPIAELRAMSAGDFQKEKEPTPNFESHAYIHAAGGVVAYTHPCRIWRGTWGGRNGFPVQEEKFVSNMAQELPFDTIAGPTYDSIDVMMTTRESLVNELGEQLWFMLLNQGYRIPATTSTDASFDNPGGANPGTVRVYTQIDGAVSVSKVAAGIKAGRNFITSGPLLEFTVDEHRIGDVIAVAHGGKRAARIRAWASGAPGEHLTRIDVIRNGEIFKSIRVPASARHHEAVVDLQEAATAWYVVKCFGSNADQVAISNPIYFEDPTYRAPVAAQANVELEIVDAQSRKPLDGTVEIVQMIGRAPQVLSTGDIRQGKTTLTAPATARLRVHASGYEPQMKSIFIDTPELLNLTKEMQLAELLDWKTFEQIRTLLTGIRLRYEMRPSA